jgi:prevent-host-death family protein
MKSSLSRQEVFMSCQLQQAKQSLIEVIRFAKTEGPQMITQHGQESVWILSSEDYHRLSKKKENIVDFFSAIPASRCRNSFGKEKRFTEKN